MHIYAAYEHTVKSLPWIPLNCVIMVGKIFRFKCNWKCVECFKITFLFKINPDQEGKYYLNSNNSDNNNNDKLYCPTAENPIAEQERL